MTDCVSNPLYRLLVRITATFFGTGLSPKAPGTAGSLAALPLCWWISGQTLTTQIAFWLVALGVGIWAATEFSHLTGSKDSPKVVIDEVLGMGIACWTVSGSVEALGLSFLLFRFFDIAKLPPVRQLDSWSKKQTGWKSGFGIVADDLVAGIQALILVVLAQKMGWII